jgi:hypothetical protein
MDPTNYRNLRRRQRIPKAWITSMIVIALAAFLYLFPAWLCAPFRMSEVLSSEELPPPVPANCVPTSDQPSAATLQRLEAQRQSRGLIFNGTMTCKLATSRTSHADRAEQQKWLENFYIDGTLQFNRHVFLAATQDVPGGTLFTVEMCLVPTWTYLNQPQDGCWEKYAFWK